MLTEQISSDDTVQRNIFNIVSCTTNKEKNITRVTLCSYPHPTNQLLLD